MKYLLATVLILAPICVFARSVGVGAKSKVINKVYLNDSVVLERWQNFENKVKEGANAAVKMILPYLMDGTSQMNISRQCIKDVMHLISGLKRIKPWAVRFFDSSSKIIDGMFVGTLSSFGIFNECIDTEVLNERGKDKGKLLFRGQYCSIDLKLPVPKKTHYYKLDDIIPVLQNFSKGGTAISKAAEFAQFMHFMSYRMGICVPSGCTIDDIDQLAKKIEDGIGLDARVSRCEVKEKLHFTPFQISILCAFALPVVLTIIGTSFGLYSYFKKVTFQNLVIRIFMCFNFIENFRKFANTDTNEDNLSCIHGIRFLTMTWVVLGHTYLIVNYQLFIEMEITREYAKDFAFQAIANSSVAVDTFYCMGGLLVCYLTIKLVKVKKLPFNIPIYIIHRLFRIWPIYIYAIISMMLIDQMGSGPVYHENTNVYIEACHDNWWTNLLFINNFYEPERMCLPQSWYIASDFQFYVGSLIILIPMLRWPKVGLGMIFAVIVASIIYSGAATVINNYPYAMLFTHPDPVQRIEYWGALYFKPFIHASPYSIGLLAGYILATKPNLKIPVKIQVVGWCISFIAMFSSLYGVFEWNKGRDPGMVEGLFYTCLFRTAWTMSVAWVIVCCTTGHGGVVNYILSWNPLIPLGRLSFIVYLIHPVVQITVFASIKTLLQPDHLIGVYFFFGHLCLTYLIAFAASMTLESPSLALEKIIFNPSRKKPANHVRKNSTINGTLKMQKNGETIMIVSDLAEEPRGVDNDAVVYKL